MSRTLREANKRSELLERDDDVLRRGAAYLLQAHLPGMYSLVRELAGWSPGTGFPSR